MNFAKILLQRSLSSNVTCPLEYSFGASGSGKSTLLRCINRLETTMNGSILIDSIPLSVSAKQINQIRREVGMVFQQFNLFLHSPFYVWSNKRIKKHPRR